MRILFSSVPCVSPQRCLRARDGQAVIEYVIMTLLLLSTVVVLSVFLYTYKQHSDRVVNLVASEYP
jgi:hypothetical protein